MITLVIVISSVHSTCLRTPYNERSESYLIKRGWRFNHLVKDELDVNELRQRFYKEGKPENTTTNEFVHSLFQAHYLCFLCRLV